MSARLLSPRRRFRERSSKAVLRLLQAAGLLPPTGNGNPHVRPTRRRIAVWDARLGCFRTVDPDDRHDPLGEAARLLAALEEEGVAADGRAGLEPANRHRSEPCVSGAGAPGNLLELAAGSRISAP
jgi:hypothetical protein